MANTPSSPFPCPVCEGCDHDMRSGLLEFVANVKANLDAAMNSLLDGMEADDDGTEQFGDAMLGAATVAHQIDVLGQTIPQIALIKSATHEDKQ